MIEEEKGEAWDEKISVWKLFCLGENKKKSKQRRSTRFTFFFLSLSLFSLPFSSLFQTRMRLRHG